MTTNIEMSEVVYGNVMSTGTPLSGKKEDPAPPLSLPPTIPPTQPSTYLFQSTTHKPVHLSTPSTFLSYIHQSPVHLPHPPTGTVRCVTCPLYHNVDMPHALYVSKLKGDPTVSHGPLCHMPCMQKSLYASNRIPGLTLAICHTGPCDRLDLGTLRACCTKRTLL